MPLFNFDAFQQDSFDRQASGSLGTTIVDQHGVELCEQSWSYNRCLSLPSLAYLLFYCTLYFIRSSCIPDGVPL